MSDLGVGLEVYDLRFGVGSDGQSGHNARCVSQIDADPAGKKKTARKRLPSEAAESALRAIRNMEKNRSGILRHDYV